MYDSYNSLIITELDQKSCAFKAMKAIELSKSSFYVVFSSISRNRFRNKQVSNEIKIAAIGTITKRYYKIS